MCFVPCKKVLHKIELIPRASSIIKRLYKMSTSKEKEVAMHISKYLEKGIVRPSYSPFCFPFNAS